MSLYDAAPADCHVRYHPDYQVHAASSTRTYYKQFPTVIQVAQHYFIEAQLLEFFTNGMVFGWYVTGVFVATSYHLPLRF